MSSTTITDPTGVSPTNAYNNDKNLTKDVLLNVENANVAKSKGLTKLNTLIDFTSLPNRTVTQKLVAGTDTTKLYFNFLRTEIPADCTLIEVAVVVSKLLTPTYPLDGSNYFTMTAERATYTTSNVIPEAQWTALGSIVMDGMTVSDLYSNSSFTQAFNAGDSFRLKVVQTGSAFAYLQMTATFMREHT